MAENTPCPESGPETPPQNISSWRKRERTQSSPTKLTSVIKRPVLRERNECDPPVKCCDSKEVNWNQWSGSGDDVRMLTHIKATRQDQWPGKENDSHFWKEVATYVNKTSKVHRTATACYSRVKNWFKPNYATVSLALDSIAQSVQSRASQTVELDDAPDEDLLSECGNLLEKLLRRKSIPHSVRKESTRFISDVVDAVVNLSQHNLYNSIFGLAKAVAQNKSDNNQQVLPFDRVTYQLLSYNVQFANGGHKSFPLCPSAYADWIDTLYTQFGGKFMRIFRGPYYEGIPDNQQYPYNCKFNVACIGVSAIQKRRVNRQKRGDHYFSADTPIQVNALQKVAALNPAGRYWIKSDATDLNPCLQESKKTHQWFGDSDVGDGKLQKVNALQKVAALYSDHQVEATLRDMVPRKLSSATMPVNISKVPVGENQTRWNKHLSESAKHPQHTQRQCARFSSTETHVQINQKSSTHRQAALPTSSQAQFDDIKLRPVVFGLMVTRRNWRLQRGKFAPGARLFN